jgi:ubiquinone/menaquinone biosynthesis C-methylase UbiE
MSIDTNKDLLVEQDWDIYWKEKEKKGSSSILYDKIAVVYRKLVITRVLSHFLRKHLAPGSIVLHAGCGSGQVDSDIRSYLEVTALDISGNALKIYKSIHGENTKVVKGSIFQLPFPDATFDGLYNLGVLEHFTQEEIHKALMEFKRVLKPGGKIIIFWPPTFGFSVFVLDSIHFVCNKILRMNIKLHPDEITRLRSKKHALDTIAKTEFKMIDYYFGVKDLFTQAVLVAQKQL